MADTPRNQEGLTAAQQTSMRRRRRINGIITREIKGLLYDVMVMTVTSNVYTDDGQTTLTEIISDIGDALTSQRRDINMTSKTLKAILKDSPKIMNTFKKVWDYVNLDGEDPKSRLKEALDNKVDKIEGKGLSTHDLDDILYEKLTNDYTKEELDEKFEVIINKEADDIQAVVNRLDEIDTQISNLTDRVVVLEEEPNIPVVRGDDPPPGAKVGDVYAKILDEDE